MKPRNFKQAAKASLDERWYPISRAKSVKEMNQIYWTTNCALCELQRRRGHDLWAGDCGRCALKGRDKDVCCKEISEWCFFTDDGCTDVEAARVPALALVARLEKIAGITKG